MSEWFKGFIESLERLIEKPPYLLFVFIGAVLVIISLITKYNLEKTWIFFLYSVGGTIWRYIEKDFQTPLKKYDLWIRVVYHIGNLILFIVLLNYLGLM
jgi:hypothetical protein